MIPESKYPSIQSHWWGIFIIKRKSRSKHVIHSVSLELHVSQYGEHTLIIISQY